jgi:hypothetical protein
MPIVLRTKANLSALARHDTRLRGTRVTTDIETFSPCSQKSGKSAEASRGRQIRTLSDHQATAAGAGCSSEHGLPPIFLRAERSNPQLELFVAHMRERVTVNRQHIQCGRQ